MLINNLIAKITYYKIVLGTIIKRFYVTMPENYENKIHLLIKNNSEELIKQLKENEDCAYRVSLFEEKVWSECIDVYGKRKAKKYVNPLLNQYVEAYLAIMPRYWLSHKAELAHIYNVIETMYNNLLNPD